MKTEEIILTDDLFIEIYLLGYKEKGESIVIFIKDGTSVTFSAVIDSYAESNVFATRNLLKNNNVEKLNLLCWTHPHDDHSKGLTGLLDEYCGRETVFLYSCLDSSNLKDVSNLSKRIFGRVNELAKKTLNKPKFWKASPNRDIYKAIISDSTDKYFFEVICLSPNDEQTTSAEAKQNEFKHNLYSSSLLFSIGEISMLFGGDIMNKTIDSIFRDLEYKYLDYVKIPHHGSKHSTYFYEKGDKYGFSAPSIATTTVFRNKNMPCADVLDGYIKWGTNKVYCTGNVKEKEKDKDAYGIVKTTIAIKNNTYKAKTELFKNASRYTK